MRICKYILAIILIVQLLGACQRERYRSDPTNRLSKRAKKANNYLADQAIELTQENIENKPKNQKKARKRLEKRQKELNEANTNTSKVKPPKKHTGEFKFY